MKKIVNFNRGWIFTDVDTPGAYAPDFNPVNWQKITLPHDYCVTKEFVCTPATRGSSGFLQSRTLWYRKYFQLTAEELRQNISIEFQSVFMDSEVWVNGEFVGRHPYGYIGIEYDIGKFLKPGVNLICVKVNSGSQPQSRWYNGCGIYQDVNLIFRDHISAARHGTYITSSDIRENSADIRYELRIQNRSEKTETVTVKTIILEEGEPFSRKASEETVLHDIAPGETLSVSTFHMEEIGLWYPESPVLYKAVTTLLVNGAAADTCETVFGIRKAEFIPGKGFFLNGKNYKMKGECIHHDGGVSGAVFVESIWKKRLKLFKKMGCNAIRTTHNPFDEKFYRLCDQMGFFVMDEFTDVWQTPKAEFDYGNFFSEWYERDLKEFIYRDRNHPSVIIWSIGNEIRQITPEMTVTLRDYVHQLDPSRLVTCGVCGILDVHDQCRGALDVAGYNDGGGACFLYERDHEKRPDQLMIATESPHTLQTRGFYRTQTHWRDHNQPILDVPNLNDEEIFFDGSEDYHSSYDNAVVRLNVRDSWKLTSRLPYLCGEFRWTGIDYLGETSKWPLRVFQGGCIDIANFPKDHFYLYQSMWTDPKDQLSLHILPHWTHPDLAEGTKIPVVVYTNCQEAELFLNGRSLGKKPQNENLYIQWDVPYQPGTLKAAAYLEGREVITETLRTADYPCRLSVSCSDMEDISFNGLDTAQIDCAVLDQEGNFVPYGENQIHFSRIRNCSWIGSENGDPRDVTALYSRARKAFNGLAAGTVRLPEKKAPVSVTVSAILGCRYFDEKAVITIDVRNFDLYEETAAGYEVYYTLDGTSPTRNSRKYEGPFSVTDTTIVTAAIFDGEEQITEMQEIFTKGRKPPVVSRSSGNRYALKEKPVCIPCDKMKGDFFDGSFIIQFRDNGQVIRMLTKTTEQLLGYWGYDAETNRGDLWFMPGEKETFSFTDETCSRIELDNRHARMYLFRYRETLCLDRIEK